MGQVSLQLGGQTFITPMVIADSLRNAAILGLDFLETNQYVMDTSSKTLRLGEWNLSVQLQSVKSGGVPTSVSVVMPESVLIPPYSER